jgi:hypothetical protein
MLEATSPKVQEFLRAWHESERARFERDAKSLVYDEYAPKIAKDRRKYIAADRGSGGVFLIEKATEAVFSIKAYGVPNRRVGTLDSMIAAWAPRPAEMSG